MHELAITERVVSVVAERVGDAKVVRVQLALGKLSGVVPGSVRFCFDVCTAGTALAGAELDIVETPGRAQCRDCSAEVEVDELVARCPCGSFNLEVQTGREVRITEVEVV
jgi:hydrogenase nickel incorporation protein HypA/HybF